MTNKDSILEHLVWIASDKPGIPADKAHAWAAAKTYAALWDGWADLPELLTARMNKKVAA